MILAPENVERQGMLITDLESGNHVQTKGHLRDTTGYCCLGRACDIFHKVTGRGMWVRNFDDAVELDTYSFVVEDEDGVEVKESGILPEVVMEWYGFSAENPDIGPKPLDVGSDKGRVYAANWNDDGIPFPLVAEGFRNALNKQLAKQGSTLPEQPK
jgi:hypothetical protein